MTRLAIVTTHPIQYYAPWFRHLAAGGELDLKVFYLWDFGVTDKVDPAFGQAVRWDVPLLEGYEHEFVPNRSRRPGTQHFWGIDNPQLPGRLDAFNPSAVLCLGYNYATFARLMLRWDRRRSPLILRGDSHRLVPRKGVKAWLTRRILQVVFRRFAAFLYVGQANREYLRLHGVPEERLFFSPHAIDNERFLTAATQTEQEAIAWKQELGIPAGKQVILFVGKFEEKKRPLDLLRAFAAAALPNAVLLYVGSGALEEPLRQAASSIPGVYFAPFQNQSRMPRTYAAGDVIVLPSLGPSETWGLCINEAMCLAKPAIVSTHVGCAADLVIPGKSGLVFDAGNVDSLAACLRTMLQDPGRIAQMGEAARERIQHYSYQQASAGLLEALHWLGPRSSQARVAAATGSVSS